MIQLAIPRNDTQALSKVATLRAGQSYERRVSAWMAKEFKMVPQVEFIRDNRFRFIPDGLIFSSDYTSMVVVEIKNQYSPAGIKQLRDYVRWLNEWFVGKVSGLLVCGSIWQPDDVLSWVGHPMEAFDHPYALLGLSTRNLPRITDGLGMGKSTYPAVV